MANGPRTFVTLDGLRGIAALAIATRHAPEFFKSISVYIHPDGLAPYPVGPFFEGYLAVDFFFTLSGFVLAHAYGERLRAGMTAKQLMQARFVRLYPLSLLSVLLCAVVVVPEHLHDGLAVGVSISLLAAAFFLPSLGSHDLFLFNVPAWSLFFELVANAAFGLMCRWLKIWPLIAIVAGAALLETCAVLARVFGFGEPGFGAMDHGYEWGSFGAGLLRVAYSFFAGVLIYEVWKRWRPATIPWIVVAAILAAILASNPPGEFGAVFDLTAALLVFPLLVWLGAGSVVTGWSARVLSRLGLASYALYILHAPLYQVVLLVLAKAGVTGPFGWPAALAFILLALVIALSADRLFDQPVRRMLRQLGSRATPAPALSAAAQGGAEAPST
jgi:peptidoglycan/LPS O-acetylase OafA/YrhL